MGCFNTKSNNLESTTSKKPLKNDHLKTTGTTNPGTSNYPDTTSPGSGDPAASYNIRCII